MDLTEQISSFETQILEKKGKRAGIVSEKARITGVIRVLQSQFTGCLDTIKAYDRSIDRLETARDALKALMTLEPIQARRGTMTASYGELTDTGEHVYQHIDTDRIQSDDTGNNYDIETLLVDRKTFVFKCECQRFRFTKGELANGKTCKHIKKLVAEIGFYSLNSFNKREAVSKGYTTSRTATSTHDNYRLR